mmetsp:Transcript_22723/g.21948  ORF Transcript_22723/g.21948 Transcript_22723/m.21948 type:complete len:104 (-) Transcript_22723:738-1049(-)
MRVRRVAVEATPVDITLLPVERPELVSLSKEESVREAMAAVTTTLKRVPVVMPPATTVVATGPVVYASPSKKESVSVEMAVASPTRPLSLPVTMLPIKDLPGL